MRGGGGVRLFVDVIVCVGGGIIAYNLLNHHPNIVLGKNGNTSDSEWSPE